MTTRKDHILSSWIEQGDLWKISCCEKRKGGYPHQTYEKIQRYSLLVVSHNAGCHSCCVSFAVHLYERSNPDAMVGTSLRCCHGLCLHTSHKRHNRYNQPGNTFYQVLQHARDTVFLSFIESHHFIDALIFQYIQTPGLNIITEYVMGIIYPGRPIANVCFKTYGYMSMAQAVSFLNDFKLGHYMKIPPRSMFLVQVGHHLFQSFSFA